MAAKPFSALPSIIKARDVQIRSGLTKLVRRAAQAAGEAAVIGTRVDTGVARSNWRASLNAPVASVIPAYAAGNKLGFTERGNAMGATAQHRSVLAAYTADRSPTIFITNNVFYIGTLNFGGPRVPPGNMLALARLGFKIGLTSVRVLKP